MKKIFLLISGIFFIFSCKNQAQNSLQVSPTEANANQNMEKLTIYSYKVTDLDGNEFDFATLKGKKVLIVNTASKCGLTPQYKELEELYKKYKDRDFVIIGFPANNFASQEPGTDKEIMKFCQSNYGVTFPMMSKVSVVGEDICDVYRFLTMKSKNRVIDSKVEWNFQKYLINEKGELEKVIKPQTTPMSPEITNWIQGIK